MPLIFPLLLNFRQVNLMDPQQTDLPQFDLAHLNCIAGGPYQVKLANGYITSIQVRKIKTKQSGQYSSINEQNVIQTIGQGGV